MHEFNFPSPRRSFASLTFDEKLDRLAEVAVRVGLNLRAGQELVLTAPTEALPLVRRITEHAYRAGALLVTTFYSDDPCVLARYENALDASFDYAPVWLHDAIAAAFKSGAARMAIAGWNPALLAGQDPAKVARANIAASKAAKPAMELITRHEINWTIVAAATPEWAKAGLSRRAGGAGGGQAVGGDLCGLADYGRRSRGRLAGPRSAL